MFRQYRTIKKDHPEEILLFRMGDFYEMFYEDAIDASRLLELTLTARGKGTANEAPMCGFPHHQLGAYAARLVRAGRRVAVCDQVEDPRKAKGLVRREVVRIITPGTVLDPGELEAKENCWAAAVALVAGKIGAAFLDASTGEFLAWEAGADADQWGSLADRMNSFTPREIIHPEGFLWNSSTRTDCTAGALLTEADPYPFTFEPAERLLKKHFEVASLDGFGLKGLHAATAAAGGLLLYLQETQKSGLEHIDRIARHEPAGFLSMDQATRRNLEIERCIRSGGRHGSLLQTIDRTCSAAGGRLLRSRLLAPLVNPERINARLDAVEEFVHRHDLRAEARRFLGRLHDIERLVGRTVAGTSGPRDLAALGSSLEALPDLRNALAELARPLTRKTLDGMDTCDDLALLLAAAIDDNPPVAIRDGGIIRDGYNEELDELRTIQRDGKAYIASLEDKEREATGISSLKVRFNKVFGYFIEVSKPNLALVPDHYHRKQTIANGERFVTPELKEYETKILNAQERIESLEYDLFCTLRSKIAAAAPRLKATARATAVLDVLSALAENAALNDYTRPTIHDGRNLEIKGGRHPVVELSLTDERFVPNDTFLETGGEAIAILTGPNMGGKSTYLRQVAQIVLLAQAGSFIPAESAEIGVNDRIFCRVGASDSLAEGQSTFMVEMTETANILHHASSRSLVLLDEIGRGTSTFDGLSIAWAVVEYLHSGREAPPRTLFATHYHELTELAVELRGVKNLRMAVRESGGDVVFTHRVENGAADRSYGIQVARLAGIPAAVVRRASEILLNLEKDSYGRDGLPRLARTVLPRAKERNPQPSLFTMMAEPERDGGREDPAAAEIIAELREKDPGRITPLEALQLLHSWRNRLDGE